MLRVTSGERRYLHTASTRGGEYENRSSQLYGVHRICGRLSRAGLVSLTATLFWAAVATAETQERHPESTEDDHDHPRRGRRGGTFARPSVSSARWDTLLLSSDGSVYGCARSPDYVLDPDNSGLPVLQLTAGSALWISAGRTYGYADSLLLADCCMAPDAPPSNPPIAGYAATYYIDAEGKVMAAGENDFGQLGDPAITESSSSYSSVKRRNGRELQNIRELAAGSAFAVAFDDDGKVWTWGHNGYGELGDGTLIDRPYADKVPELEGIVAVSASAVATSRRSPRTYRAVRCMITCWRSMSTARCGPGARIVTVTPAMDRSAS